MPVKFSFKPGAFNGIALRLDKIANPEFTKALATELGEIIVAEMKDLISKGVSPIKGNSRFKPYKGSYKAGIQAGRYPGKSMRPVNLNLSGDFLASLKPKAPKISKDSIEVVINYSKAEQVKEEGHRKQTKGQEYRPTLPQGSESFSSVITQKVRQRVAEFILKFVKKV